MIILLTYIFILATFDATVRLYKQLFLLETLNAVAVAAGASPLRITNPKFYFQDDRAFFVATLVDAAPTIGNNYCISYSCSYSLVFQTHIDQYILYVIQLSDRVYNVLIIKP